MATSLKPAVVMLSFQTEAEVDMDLDGPSACVPRVCGGITGDALLSGERHFIRCADFSFSRQISSTSSVSGAMRCRNVTVQGFV